MIVKSNSLFHSFLGQHKRQAELSSSQRHISIRRQQTKQVASRRHKTFSPQLSIIVNKLNQDITNTFSQPKTHLTIMEGHQDRIPDGARSNLNTFPIYLYVPGTDNRTQSVLPEKIFWSIYSCTCQQWGFHLPAFSHAEDFIYDCYTQDRFLSLASEPHLPIRTFYPLSGPTDPNTGNRSSGYFSLRLSPLISQQYQATPQNNIFWIINSVLL